MLYTSSCAQAETIASAPPAAEWPDRLAAAQGGDSLTAAAGSEAEPGASPGGLPTSAADEADAAPAEAWAGADAAVEAELLEGRATVMHPACLPLCCLNHARAPCPLTPTARAPRALTRTHAHTQARARESAHIPHAHSSHRSHTSNPPRQPFTSIRVLALARILLLYNYVLLSLLIK